MPSEQRRKAEKAARTYLEMRGHKILEQNWGLGRNKIDLITLSNKTVSFIEIHYNVESTGFDTLTETKLKKLRNAAEAWIMENKYTGDYNFSAIDISGPGYTILGYNEGLDV